MYQACKNGDLTYIAENGNNIGVNEITFIGQRGHLELVKYLYFRGHDMSELLEQACKYEHCDVVDWLMTTDIRLPPNILRFPCHNGNTNIFKALVGKGANVNFAKYPLFNAVRSGHVHIIHELYLCGANQWYLITTKATHYIWRVKPTTTTWFDVSSTTAFL